MLRTLESREQNDEPVQEADEVSKKELLQTERDLDSPPSLVRDQIPRLDLHRSPPLRDFPGSGVAAVSMFLGTPSQTP